jgi:hypothetical protein
VIKETAAFAAGAHDHGFDPDVVNFARDARARIAAQTVNSTSAKRNLAIEHRQTSPIGGRFVSIGRKSSRFTNGACSAFS